MNPKKGDRMKTWEEIKDKVHDASGIDPPEDFMWYRFKGIYYPVLDKQGHEGAVWILK